MRRSVGVTVWAILLIVAGCVTGLSALASLSAGPRTLDALDARIAQLETAPTGTGQGQIPPERLEQMRRQLAQFTTEVRALTNSPTVRIVALLRTLLGAAGLAAGIGILFVRDWARLLALVQAGVSIPLGVWAMSLPLQHRLAEAMLRLYEVTLDPASLTRVRHMIRMGETIGQWSGVLALLVWNGLILWFFTRASVKAQFKSA